jgi:hypothetical protein
MRGRISSDIADLNTLHKTYPWIPDETMIRPSPDLVKQKLEIIHMIDTTWKSLKDYILCSVFAVPFDENEKGIHYATTYDTSHVWMFSPALFRYNLPVTASHFILWNSKHDFYHDFDDATINDKINEYLDGLVGSYKYKFAWYKNPKPSVIDFYHVQVFWSLI